MIFNGPAATPAICNRLRCRHPPIVHSDLRRRDGLCGRSGQPRSPGVGGCGVQGVLRHQVILVPAGSRPGGDRGGWTELSSDGGASEEGRRRIQRPEGTRERSERRERGPRARASAESIERAQRTHLEQIRAAGLVHQASERPAENIERVLPVAAALRPLLPGGVLRRGSTVALPPGPAAGSTSLLFALLAEASAAGSWCALVGLPHLGLVSAAEVGLE